MFGYYCELYAKWWSNEGSPCDVEQFEPLVVRSACRRLSNNVIAPKVISRGI
ncbi:hypothetical protein TERTU_3769 [Teredinibacter turnerae T7901]|uniref:Uncharacterized protein n=1 Tax=Teredinibacter turnerae (strain ATCC 39867 / T7901) TaxID=377629 RepID=C5BSS9_TERTT|nr:hypothetical protein TERTU_3769 [Teredinibacter turnerae T7901]